MVQEGFCNYYYFNSIAIYTYSRFVVRALFLFKMFVFLVQLKSY